MTPNTKIGLVIALFFLIGMGMLLSRAASTGPQVAPNNRALLPPAPPPAPRGQSRDTFATGGTRAGQPVQPGQPQQNPGDLLVARSSVQPTTPGAMPGSPAIDAGQTRPGDGSLVTGQPGPSGAQPAQLAIPGPGQPIPSGALTMTNIAAGPQPVALPPGWTMHRVAAGETLSAISNKYYQTSKKYDAIFRANRDRLASVNQVREGMELLIPPGKPVAAVTPAPAPVAPVTPGGAAVRPAPGPALRPAPGGPRDPLIEAAPDLLERVPAGRSPLGGTSAPGVAPVRPMSGSGGGTYKIKAGDTLTSIASTTLGSRSQWKALWQANKDVLPDPNRLPVGVVLHLPETRVASVP